MKPVTLPFSTPHFHPLHPPLHSHSCPPQTLHFPPPISYPTPPLYSNPNHNQTHLPTPQTNTQYEGIPMDYVKELARFKSRYNYIRVLDVLRTADHPMRGCRLLLLDGPGNIHSMSFRNKFFTDAYYDVFATLPPILPPGPVGILGFGAGSAAKLLLELYPNVVVHGWELDPAVIDVAREFFSLSKLENDCKNRIFINIGNAFYGTVRDGFAGILVDLFRKGCLLPELQDPFTWEKMRRNLRRGGRIMVNVGGSCIEAEDSRKDGRLIMEATLRAMHEVFGDQLYVMDLGEIKDDSSLALTGDLPDLNAWKAVLRKPLIDYADMWTPYRV